jgi:hypothetical protein
MATTSYVLKIINSPIWIFYVEGIEITKRIPKGSWIGRKGMTEERRVEREGK